MLPLTTEFSLSNTFKVQHIANNLAGNCLLCAGVPLAELQSTHESRGSQWNWCLENVRCLLVPKSLEKKNNPRTVDLGIRKRWAPWTLICLCFSSHLFYSSPSFHGLVINAVCEPLKYYNKKGNRETCKQLSTSVFKVVLNYAKSTCRTLGTGQADD